MSPMWNTEPFSFWMMLRIRQNLRSSLHSPKNFRLLDCSRQQPQPFAQIDINTLLHETLVLLKPHFKDLPIEVVEEWDPTNPVILGNEGKLQQVFTNLLLNAKDAMHKGGRLLARTETEGDNVIINIVDTGDGIPERDLKRIYEPFFTTKKGS